MHFVVQSMHSVISQFILNCLFYKISRTLAFRLKSRFRAFRKVL